VDGDGDVDVNDRNAALAASGKSIYETGYNVHADVNRDGVVDSADTSQIVSTNYQLALPVGVLSSDKVGNIIGYCGYIYNPETQLYTVRFRHYDPQWGRWISRDPAGYVDGMSLYGYGTSSPVGMTDPFGLSAQSDAIDFLRDRLAEVLDILGTELTYYIQSITVDSSTHVVTITIVLTIGNRKYVVTGTAITILDEVELVVAKKRAGTAAFIAFQEKAKTAAKVLRLLDLIITAANLKGNLYDVWAALFQAVRQDDGREYALFIIDALEALRKSLPDFRAKDVAILIVMYKQIADMRDDSPLKYAAPGVRQRLLDVLQGLREACR
jgi:RHS repeat-associated protein